MIGLFKKLNKAFSNFRSPEKALEIIVNTQQVPPVQEAMSLVERYIVQTAGTQEEDAPKSQSLLSNTLDLLIRTTPSPQEKITAALQIGRKFNRHEDIGPYGEELAHFAARNTTALLQDYPDLAVGTMLQYADITRSAHNAPPEKLIAASAARAAITYLVENNPQKFYGSKEALQASHDISRWAFQTLYAGGIPLPLEIYLQEIGASTFAPLLQEPDATIHALGPQETVSLCKTALRNLSPLKSHKRAAVATLGLRLIGEQAPTGASLQTAGAKIRDIEFFRKHLDACHPLDAEAGYDQLHKSAEIYGAKLLPEIARDTDMITAYNLAASLHHTANFRAPSVQHFMAQNLEQLLQQSGIKTAANAAATEGLESQPGIVDFAKRHLGEIFYQVAGTDRAKLLGLIPADSPEIAAFVAQVQPKNQECARTFFPDSPHQIS